MNRHSLLNACLSFIFLVILGAGIWWMSDSVVWLGDDLDYKYKMRGAIWQSWGFINTWSDFLQSQLTHYINVNGRFVVHSLVQLFNGILGQKVFAIINAFMYMSFALMIAKCGMVKFNSNCGGVLTAICLSVVCFMTKMMPTCQIGYTWGMLANLLWLNSFFSSGCKSWGSVIWLAFIGILIGNWQESISIGVCAGLGFWWLSQFFNRHETFHSFFDWKRSWIMLGYFIGTATVCLSPATLSRVSTVTTPLTDQLIVALYSIPAIILLLIVIIALSFRRKLSIPFNFNFDAGSIPDGFLIIAILFLIAFNVLIGVYSNRQLFGANLFAAILMLKILPRHRFNFLFNLLAVLVVAISWHVMYLGITEVKRQYDDIAELFTLSEDGYVDYDRTRVMTLGHPLAAKYYEDILGQFDNDLHHSLMKDFKHERRGNTLKLRPATIPNAEKVEQYAPGHFYVTVELPLAGNKEKEVTVFGHYSFIKYINIPAQPRKLKLLKFARKLKPFATAIVIPEYPLFVADSISLSP